VSEKKEEAKETAAPAAPVENTPPLKKKIDPKAILSALTGKLGSIKKPSIDAKTIKGSIIELMRSLLNAPGEILRAGWVTKLIFLAFIGSLVLLVYTGPKVIGLFFPKHEVTHETADEETYDEEVEHDLAAPIKGLAFLGKYQEGDYEIEFFAECESEELADEIREKISEVKKNISGILKNYKSEELNLEESQMKLQGEIQKNLREIFGAGIKEVVITSWNLK